MLTTSSQWGGSNSCLDGNDPDKNSLSEKLKGQEQPSFLPFLARADRRADSNDIRAQAPDATSDKRERTDWTGNVKSYDIDIDDEVDNDEMGKAVDGEGDDDDDDDDDDGDDVGDDDDDDDDDDR